MTLGANARQANEEAERERLTASTNKLLQGLIEEIRGLRKDIARIAGERDSG